MDSIPREIINSIGLGDDKNLPSAPRECESEEKRKRKTFPPCQVLGIRSAGIHLIIHYARHAMV